MDDLQKPRMIEVVVITVIITILTTILLTASVNGKFEKNRDKYNEAVKRSEIILQVQEGD